MMEHVKGTLLGLLRTLLYGVILGVGLTALLTGIGALATGNGLTGGLEVARSGLFMIGSLGTLLMAGLILFKRKAQEKFDYRQWIQWQNRFGKLSFGAVLGMICLLLLVTGIVLDYLIRM